MIAKLREYIANPLELTAKQYELPCLPRRIHRWQIRPRLQSGGDRRLCIHRPDEQHHHVQPGMPALRAERR